MSDEPNPSDRSTVVRALDANTGNPVESVTFSTSGLELWYRREGGTRVSITPVEISSVDAAHLDGGFIHIDDGYCRVDLPDAAVALGADSVVVGGSAPGVVLIGNEIAVFNSQTSGAGAVRWPLTINTTGGVPILGVSVWVTSDSSGHVIVAGTEQTDASGQVLVWLDEGDYYVWAYKSGYSFSNPSLITVVED